MGREPERSRGGRVVEAAAACAVNLRSRNLRCAQAAFGLIWAGEWTATVVVGVLAYRRGGASAVGWVGVARMVPSGVIAPLAAIVADRMPRDRVLAGVSLIRAVSLGLAGTLVAMHSPLGVIFGLVALATVAQTLFRPTHSALLPTLCVTPAELTSANVVRGILDSLATLLGPLAAALLLGISGPAAALVASAAASGIAAVLILALRYEAPPRLDRHRGDVAAVQVIEGLRAIAADRALVLLTALATIQTFVRGALTVFSVAVAIDLLHSGDAGVGLLTAALGAGAVVGSLAASLLIGRGGLARWFGLGVGLWGAPLIVIGLAAVWLTAAPMLAIVGLGNALVDVGVFTLIGRLADDAVLARAYAAFEGSITLGVAAGALITPALITALGLQAALVLVGVLAPAAVVCTWPALRRLDVRIRVRDGDVELLQRIPMLRVLPQAAIEQLASRLGRDEVPEGASVFEQGDEGDSFYVIESGWVTVTVDGRPVRRLGPGEGFGEIALIRACTRTAAARAEAPLTLRALHRSVFVTAMTGYSPSATAVNHVIDEYLRG
jgi:hypothetical protein